MHDIFYYSGSIDQTKNKALAECRTEYAWILNESVDYTDFDLRWLPDRHEQNQAHAWGSHNNANSHTTWLLPVDNLRRGSVDSNYHDRVLPGKQLPQIHWPNFVDTHLTGSDWYNSLCNWLLNQNIDHKWVWVVDDRLDYSNFDFDWLPDSWDSKYIHCWTNANSQKLSYTWLVNLEVLANREYCFHSSNIKFKHEHGHCETVLLDMGLDLNDYPWTRKIRYTGNMQQVLINAITRCESEWLQILSNSCSYSTFDFNWKPDLDQIEYVHCWPTTHQEKGETFLIHVPSFQRTQNLNFDFNHPPVKRNPWPAVIYTQDSIAGAMNNNTRPGSLYAVYYKPQSVIHKFPEPCLWDNRPVVSLNRCHSVCLVPRDCVVSQEIYEYPYLLQREEWADEEKLDIVFITNGEKDARSNYDKLVKQVSYWGVRGISHGHSPRLKAYQEAAKLSQTDWFLAVFAKCTVNEDFMPFNWLPDYWQKPKHYIFYNNNIDLDLTYGHMAPVAYNVNLLMANAGGIDITQSQEHAVVPRVISSTQLTEPWEIWRTAFRETVKLMYYNEQEFSVETQYRLTKWLDGNGHIWYQRGSRDAVNFYEATDGSWHWLMMTSEWDWLRQRFDSLYSSEVLTT